jgi:hypothetical protein
VKDLKKYNKVKSLINRGRWKDLFNFLNPINSIKEAFEGKAEISLEDGYLIFDGEKMPKSLVSILTDYESKKMPINHLIKFWKNLKGNPSEKSRKQLFEFLTKNEHPITKDGRFLAYKKVDYSSTNKKKFVDNYTKKIDNSIGKVVWMDRKKVNPDPDQTCSNGLHVASWNYAKSYSGDVLIEVLVNPKDVVAVPNDYNNSKMRVCEYYVYGLASSERRAGVVDIKIKPKKKPLKKVSKKKVVKKKKK